MSSEEESPNSQARVSLLYGYEPRQGAAEGEIGSFLWSADTNSLLMQTSEGRSILGHYFRVPVKHKVQHFSSSVTSWSRALETSHSLRYLSICLGAHIRLYNIHDGLSYIRSIDTLY